MLCNIEGFNWTLASSLRHEAADRANTLLTYIDREKEYVHHVFRKYMESMCPYKKGETYNLIFSGTGTYAGPSMDGVIFVRPDMYDASLIFSKDGCEFSMEPEYIEGSCFGWAKGVIGNVNGSIAGLKNTMSDLSEMTDMMTPFRMGMRVGVTPEGSAEKVKGVIIYIQFNLFKAGVCDMIYIVETDRYGTVSYTEKGIMRMDVLGK